MHYALTKIKSTTRQSISLTTPNDDWLKSQVGVGKEYTSKSDVVNDLIRQARATQEKTKTIRRKLREAEQSGFVEDTHPDRMLARIKVSAQHDQSL